MAVYTGRSGRIYKESSRLGEGGEGRVTAVEGDSQLVLKLYKTDKFKTLAERKTLERKLLVMISMNVPLRHNGNVCLAWPQDILYENGQMVGFVMPKIATKHKIYDIYRGGKNSVRERLHPGYNWKYSVQYAHNLAWIVDQLHRRNIVIGDFNQNNVAVDTTTGTIILVDCDSFDIRDPATGEHFPCGVGLPEMLAPELQQVRNLANGKFTKESDNFSLAIHIFRLLMENADPFGGKVTDNGASSVSCGGENRAIINGECAYVRTVQGKTIPQWSPKLDVLPKEVAQLFSKTFNYTALSALRQAPYRATAAEWMRALAPYGAPEPNALLKRCTVKTNHVYPIHNSRCPWCALNTTTVVPPKVTPTYTPPKTTPTYTSTPYTPPKTTPTYTSTPYTPPRTTPRSTPSRSTYRKKRTPWGKIIAAILCITLLLGAAGYLITNPPQIFQEGFGQIEWLRDLREETIPYESEYIFPESHRSYLTRRDLEGLTQEELCLARNEIFARHGRIFTTEWIQDYFLSKQWYEPLYTPEEFDPTIESIFNVFEKANVDFIKEYEKEMGYR